MKNKKSFTLIELLIVIGVLAGLMTLLVPNFMLVRVKSRDVRRKSDLKAIQKSLELYKLDQVLPSLPVYPAALSTLAGTVKYMQSIPHDPSYPSASDYYYNLSGDFTSYTLCACLENVSDSEGSTCPGALACASTIYYKLNEP